MPIQSIIQLLLEITAQPQDRIPLRRILNSINASALSYGLYLLSCVNNTISESVLRVMALEMERGLIQQCYSLRLWLWLWFIFII